MKHKFIMMEIEAGLLVLSGRGLYHNSLQQPNSPPYPSAIYSYTPWMIIYNVPDSNGLAGEQMDLQVYTNPYIQDQWKGRVIAITQNGDLVKDVSTWPSMYIKTLTNKEKFPY